MLHFPPRQQGAAVKPGAYHAAADGNTVTLLGTAVVPCVDKYGTIQMGPALIDTGSSLNMVTQEFAAKLKFNPKPCEYRISTVGNSDPQSSQGTIDFYLTTTDGKAAPVHVLIIDQCTGKLPVAKLNVGMIAELGGKLADPKKQIRKKIEFLKVFSF